MKCCSRISVMIVCAILPLLAVGGCTPIGVAVGAAATVGTAAIEERGVDGAANDAALSTDIARRFLEADHRLLSSIEVTVHERRVLLMGVVSDPAMKETAVRLVRDDPDVIVLYDYIDVRSDDSIDLARDIAIASELRPTLMFDSRISAVNYAVDVVDRTVYVIGLAQDEAEKKRVLDWCRGTAYVRRVVDLIWLKTDPRRRAPSDRRPL